MFKRTAVELTPGVEGVEKRWWNNRSFLCEGRADVLWGDDGDVQCTPYDPFGQEYKVSRHGWGGAGRGGQGLPCKPAIEAAMAD